MSDIHGFFNRVGYSGSTEPHGPWRLLFFCPGCKSVHGLTVGPEHPSDPGSPRWTWNGSYDKPIFGPSLLVRWRQYKPEARARDEEHMRLHGVYRPEGVEPKDEDYDHHICHSFIGCNGAAPGQIIFLHDCTHALKGQIADIPLFSWD